MAATDIPEHIPDTKRSCGVEIVVAPNRAEAQLLGYPVPTMEPEVMARILGAHPMYAQTSLRNPSVVTHSPNAFVTVSALVVAV